MALAASKRGNAENDAHATSAANRADSAVKSDRKDAAPPPVKRTSSTSKKRKTTTTAAMTTRAKRLSDAELEIARKLSFSAALEKEPGEEDEEDDHKVQIVIRIRPLVTDAAPELESATANSSNEEECFRVLSETALLAHPPKTSQSYRSTGTATSFHFSRIFTPQTAQQELFEATTRPVLEAAFTGKNGLVFAYGVTNSGKTYTITGTDEQAGVLPRALKFVMEELGRRKENEEAPVTKITASYLEIYNENVYDLLTAPVRKRRALRLQDCDGKIQVRGMMERSLKSLKDAEELLATGQKNKQVAETNCNMDSSRSHCIFSLYFYHQVNRGTTALRSKVSIVDLAGSERSAKTGATGLRMQEASKINGSLMNLMRCLETMRWNQQHPPSLHKMVPFRESKLTRLFQENLIGRRQGPLVMIVAVNPSSHEFDETLRTLKYSAMARELVPVQKNSGRKSVSSTYYDLDGRLRKRRRTSAEGEAAVGGDQVVPTQKQGEPVKRESFGRHMKREPSQAANRRPPLRTVRLSHATHAPPAATVNAAVVTQMERELEAHRQRAAQLEQENNELRIQLSQTNAEKLQMEVKIRSEVGNEMREQLQQIKAQYREMLERQRSGTNESSSTSTVSLSSAIDDKERAAWKQEKAAMQQKIKLLQEQLTECEDEMKRIQERHERELDCVLMKRERGEGNDDEELEDEPEEI